jgi:regulator of replication initiation timing
MASSIEDSLAQATAAAATPNPLTAVGAAAFASPEAAAATDPPSLDDTSAPPIPEASPVAVSPPMDKASVTAVCTDVCQSVVQREMDAFSATLRGDKLNPLGNLVNNFIQRVIVIEKSLAPALSEVQTLHSENKALKERVSALETLHSENKALKERVIALDRKLIAVSEALTYLASAHNCMKQHYDGFEQITSLFSTFPQPAPPAPGSKRPLDDDDLLQYPPSKTPRGNTAENESDATHGVDESKSGLRVKDYPDHNLINGKAFTNDTLAAAKDALEKKEFIVSGSTIKAHVLPKTFSFMFKSDLIKDVISPLDDDTNYTILIDSVNQARRSRPFPITVTISNGAFSISGHFSFLNLQNLGAFPDIFSNQLYSA